MSKSFHIVIADDDLDDHLLVTRALKDLSQDVVIHSVYDGSELLTLLKHFEDGHLKIEKPDCILLDINMPKISGLMVLTEIKKTEILLRIPVFVLTTTNSQVDFMTASQLGAKACFTKPADFEQLRKLLSNILSDIGIVQA